MERKSREGKAIAEDSEEDEGISSTDGLRATDDGASRKGTVKGATAKLCTTLVSPAVGYRIEGGGLSEEDLAASSSSAPKNLIDNVFDLEGNDNDYKYYQTKFVNKGAPLRWPLASLLVFGWLRSSPQENTSIWRVRTRKWDPVASPSFTTHRSAPIALSFALHRCGARDIRRRATAILTTTICCDAGQSTSEGKRRGREACMVAKNLTFEPFVGGSSQSARSHAAHKSAPCESR